MTSIKKTDDMKAYMKAYRASSNIKCDVCGGNYNEYTREKHLATNKHVKAGIKSVSVGEYIPVVELASIVEPEPEPEAEPEPIVEPTLLLNKIEIMKWLEERFVSSSRQAEGSMSKRTDKNLSLFKKMYDGTEDKSYNFWLEHRTDIIRCYYKTPSGQQSALSCIKLVLDYVKPLSVEDKQTIAAEGKALIDEYKAAVVPVVGMDYAELKKYELHPNNTVALYARLYNPQSPPLRLNDWLNAFVGSNPTANEINLKKGTMLRRIKKNVGEPDLLKLHPDLIKFFKKEKITGHVFKWNTAAEITSLVQMLMPNSGVRHWRTKYVSDVVSKQTGAERIASAKYMNHSLETQIQVYQKD